MSGNKNCNCSQLYFYKWVNWCEQTGVIFSHSSHNFWYLLLRLETLVKWNAKNFKTLTNSWLWLKNNGIPIMLGINWPACLGKIGMIHCVISMCQVQPPEVRWLIFDFISWRHSLTINPHLYAVIWCCHVVKLIYTFLQSRHSHFFFHNMKASSACIIISAITPSISNSIAGALNNLSSQLILSIFPSAVIISIKYPWFMMAFIPCSVVLEGLLLCKWLSGV